MAKITDSELILNPDGSVYHLHLKADHIADDVILVGDPGRVEMVSSFFDTIDVKISNREFVTHTGWYNNHRITVISTGIGTDNIDIVLNELDAAVNINLKTKEINPKQRSLNLIRIGTSGSLRADIPVDSFLISEKAMGFDGLLHFYAIGSKYNDEKLVSEFCAYSNWPEKLAQPYVVDASPILLKKMGSGLHHGITATASGFYAPQGRTLRLKPQIEHFPEVLSKFSSNGLRITNFEMETSALYGLSAALGHHACTICAIIANRETKKFSLNHSKPIINLIEYVLNNLTI